MKKIVTILFTILLICSCEKVVEKAPLNMISDAQLWNDEVLIDAYTANLYDRTFQVIWDQGQSIPLITLTDEARTCLGWAPTLNIFTLGIITPENVNDASHFVYLWPYNLIRSLNEFLQYVEEGSLPDKFVAQRSSEVRFLRAYLYFELAMRFGGVPLITEPQSMDDDYFVFRDTEEDIYEFVRTELDEIIGILPETYPNEEYARINKYAALALKSRAMLYAASIARYGDMALDGILGVPAARDDFYFQEAYDAAKAVINEGNYALFNNYPDKALNYQRIFQEENHSEVILAKKYQGLDRGHSWDRWQLPYRYKTGVAVSVNPTLEMIDSYEFVDGTPGSAIDYSVPMSTIDLYKDKEPRFHATIQYNQSFWIDESLEIFYFAVDNDLNDPRNNNGSNIGFHVNKNATGTTQTGFYMKKYLQEQRDMELSASATDFILFRLAEMYLNLAEAAFELGGKENEAMDAINAIRDRAGVALRTSITLDQIRHERKIELAFEGLRYWDVRRWRTAVNDLSGEFHKLNTYYIKNLGTFGYEIINCQGSAVRVFNEYNYYLPIHQDNLFENHNLAQNPGYN